MTKGLLIAGVNGLLILAAAHGVAEFRPRAIDHALTIVQRPDGQFDVTCIDGVAEIRTRDEVLSNRLCTHLQTFGGVWNLIGGGVDNGSRMCDLDMNVVRSETSVLKLRASFAEPCVSEVRSTEQCTRLTCALELNQRFYAFDFSVAGQATLTRLDDGLQAVYRGHAGEGGGSRSARLTEIDGVPKILQSSRDGGLTWASVCDDAFDASEAAVACRELGFHGGVGQLRVNVNVKGDADFGWDDLACRGDENALAECQHSEWRTENCGETEHVQLTCLP